MELGLRGRTAVVCGASAGLGLAAAESLAGEGANVVMLARRADLLEREAARIGGRAVVGDVRERPSLEEAVRVAVDEYGGLDVVVANSGGPPPGRPSEIRADAIRETVELVLVPLVTLVEVALPHLLESDQARIVLVASAAVREPAPNLALSNAVRPGAVGWLKSLARELAPRGVTVNAVAPGKIATDRMAELYGGEPPAEEVAEIPVGRLGEPRELGDLVAYLCSSRAGYLTGTLIPVDGGHSRSLL